MGKRNSTMAGTAGGVAMKKAKTTDADPPTVGNWVQTKIGDKELASVEKIGLLKNDPVEVLAAGLEIIPRPPAGFRVIFLAFLLRGLSFPPHPFLRGLLFAYGIQLHALNPNTILHIACFVILCECFLGIDPHWALWRQIFVIRRPLHYQLAVSAARFAKMSTISTSRLRKTILGGGRSGFMIETSLPLDKTSGLKNFFQPPSFGLGRRGRTSYPRKR
jgi:hypothetical protein